MGRIYILLLLGAALTIWAPQHPTLYIIGDSTVRNGSGQGANKLWGWGSYLAESFDTSRIDVRNYALGGRSSRTFITEGHWDSIMARLKPGDYVIMQFGHNDGAPLDDTARARGSIRGIGVDSQHIYNPIMKKPETVHTYGWYMRKYVNDAKSKGAVAIVCSPIPRNIFKDGKVLRANSDYGLWAQQTAEQTGAYFVDLNGLIGDIYDRLGPDSVKNFFPGDHTHTNEGGARLNASVVAHGLKGVKEISEFLKAGIAGVQRHPIDLPADTIDLKGSWGFRVDPEDRGEPERWYEQKFEETVHLPGSMAENGKGGVVTAQTHWTASIYDSSWFTDPRMAKYRTTENLHLPFWLTPRRHYLGAAWYQKEVVVPASWPGRPVVLFLERPHSEVSVWVDGRSLGQQYGLSTAQVFDLTGLIGPGRHRITMRIDNRIKAINVGQDSHSLTDQTQGNWNGVVGQLLLTARASTWIESVAVYPDVAAKKARVRIVVRSLGAGGEGRLAVSAKSFNTSLFLSTKEITANYKLEGGRDSVDVELPMGDRVALWDEFSPALYRLRVRLGTDVRTVEFGMREFKVAGRHFVVNGRPIHLRGVVENCVFPLTGYPAMDEASWERIFRKAKAYGLNHMRFHSYCPPEAAFAAADRVGFYLQPEGPSWANHGSSLGDGKPVDQFIYTETERMDAEYGSHPSFCMMAYGNEPRGGRQREWLSGFVNTWKKKDARHIYTGADVGMNWPLVPNNEYMVKSGPRGLSWKGLPESESDYGPAVDTFPVPYVTHEMGQWCVYPDFREIGHYKGVYKEKNFELFRETLVEQGMGDEALRFLMASGRLQLLCYKMEIEKSLRTSNSAGFQLLGLTDYPGQGTALVGVLNALWEEKGYATAADFSRFCNATVPLVRMPRFVYRNTDTLSAAVELYHYGPSALRGAVIDWVLRDGQRVMASGSWVKSQVPIGSGNAIGDISVPLAGIRRASQLKLWVSVRNTHFANDWDCWVYPSEQGVKNSDVYYCTSLNDTAERVLAAGGKVFLNACGKVVKGREVALSWTPVFWNTSWFRMRPPHTLGVLVDPANPAFGDFPTGDHTDLQWWDVLQGAQVINLEDFPKGFRPLVQPIDTWFLNRRLALVFEARVGAGRLIVSGADLSGGVGVDRPASRQLYRSLVEYMGSAQFKPAVSIDLALVKGLFAEKPPSAAAVLKAMRLANDYFMKKWPDPGVPIVTNVSRPSHIWTRAVYYEGLLALYGIDPQKSYYDYAVDWSDKHQWSLRKGVANRNADDQCCGQTYIDLFRIDPRPGRLDSIRTAIDSMVAGSKCDDWHWIDAIQMAMPVFTRLGVVLKDTAYFRKMYDLYHFTKYVHGGHGLYNAEEHLWWRDKDFVPPYKEPNGRNCYWSRGNGWVLAALVRVLSLLPGTDPHYAEYKQDYMDMVKALAPLQRTDGFWNVSLQDPTHFGGKELSGTALFTYGMAWGINRGWLDRGTYLPMVVKAWEAMVRDALHPDGMLGWVQGTGKEPKDGQPVSYDKIPDFEDYGAGCFLLAGSEVYRLADGAAGGAGQVAAGGE